MARFCRERQSEAHPGGGSASKRVTNASRGVVCRGHVDSRALGMAFVIASAAGACAASPPPRAPYRWQLDPSSHPTECKLAPPKGCDADHTGACEAALPSLRAGCTDASPCGCARLGEAMTWSRPERHVDGVKLLDAACVTGVVDACDAALLIASLCSERPLSTPACSFLRSLGRVPARESSPGQPGGERWERAALPPQSTGCFRATSTTRDAESSAALGASAPPEPPQIFCFDASRVSFKRRVWDQAKVAWERLSDGTRWRAVGWDGPEIVFGQSLVFIDGFRLSIARMEPNDTARLRGEIARLGDYDAICARAARCEAVVQPMDWGPPRSLRECMARDQEMRSLFAQQSPGEPLPEECR